MAPLVNDIEAEQMLVQILSAELRKKKKELRVIKQIGPASKSSMKFK